MRSYVPGSMMITLSGAIAASSSSTVLTITSLDSAMAAVSIDADSSLASVTSVNGTYAAGFVQPHRMLMSIASKIHMVVIRFIFIHPFC